MKNFITIILQIVGVCLLYEFGKVLSNFFKLPIPGSIVGMFVLLGLLFSGIVKEKWLSGGVGFLLKHLSFFFIPLGVGVIAIGSLLHSGWKLVLIMAVSIIIGVIFTALSTEGLLKHKEKRTKHVSNH